jgi:hypothetical protein
MNDELQAVRQTRPDPIQGWAASIEGQLVFDEVLARTRAEAPTVPARPRHRRTALIGVTAAGIVGATGLAAAAGLLPFAGDGNSKGYGMCASTLSATADMSEPTVKFDPADPGAACAAGWEEMNTGQPQPHSFAACFLPKGNGPVVFPADGYASAAEACAAIKARPVPLPGR